MEDFSHLRTNKFITDNPRDFTEDMEDLDETICALCGLSPDQCPCYVHPPHSCEESQCDCSLMCSCCQVEICDCTVCELSDGVQ